MENGVSSSQKIQLRIAPDRVATVLFGMSALLVLVSLAGLLTRIYLDYDNLHRYIHHLVDKTNVDAELSIPAFYSVVLLLASSCLLFLVGYTEPNSVFLRRRWMILSVIFLLMSLDEASSFHEFLNVSTLQTHAPSSTYLGWTWVIPYGLFVGVVFIVYLPFLRKLPRRTAGLLLVSGALYVGGALGVEMIGSSFFIIDGPLSLSYGLTAHVEEFLEMVGLVLFIYTLIDYLLVTKWVVVLYQGKRKS